MEPHECSPEASDPQSPQAGLLKTLDSLLHMGRHSVLDGLVTRLLPVSLFRVTL
jgi:hypothetical protein